LVFHIISYGDYIKIPFFIWYKNLKSFITNVYDKEERYATLGLKLNGMFVVMYADCVDPLLHLSLIPKGEN
jgi:hypothetical protein